MMEDTRMPGETKREYLNRMRSTEKAFSEQVRDGEMSIQAGDGMAELAGLIERKSPPAKKNDKV